MTSAAPELLQIDERDVTGRSNPSTCVATKGQRKVGSLTVPQRPLRTGRTGPESALWGPGFPYEYRREHRLTTCCS